MGRRDRVLIREESLPADTEARLAGFTELVATAIANAESQAQLTASRARIAAAADTARRRIERDLHDGAQQRLISLALRLRAAKAAAPPGGGELVVQLDSLVTEATGILDELRELASGIHPGVLADGGLAGALKVLARRSAVPVELGVRVAGRLPEQIEVAAYYVVAEALTNAAKHAQASTVTVTVDTTPADRSDLLQVEVRDDGRGGAELALGTGLLGLKDRVEALGGAITVASPRGKGTTLRVHTPYHRGRAIFLEPDARPAGWPSQGPRHGCPRLFALAVMRPAAPEDMLTIWQYGPVGARNCAHSP